MRIVINALSARLGGGQTYLRHLLYRTQHHDMEIYLLATDSFKADHKLQNIKRIDLSSRLDNPIARAYWEKIYLKSLLERLDADVLFCPGGILPNRLPEKCKGVITFQNMMPFDITQRRKYPLGYMRWRHWMLKRLLVDSMRRSSLIICLSSFAKEYVESRLDIVQTTVGPVYHGIDESFRTYGAENIPMPAILKGRPYLLYVSTVDYYKSQVEVVEAFALFKKKLGGNEALVLIGSENPSYGIEVRRSINKTALDDDVFFTGNIPHESLPAWYHHAAVNIFASHTENCPNIVLEMLPSGRPSAVSNIPPMTELCADACAYFDPDRPEQISDCLVSLISDSRLSTELARKGFERSQSFDWDVSARKTWDAIKALSSDKHP